MFPVDFDDLRARARSWPMSEKEAQDLAHAATSGILDCSTAADLCEELTETLKSIETCDWLGKGVGAAMRERAVDLIDQIERATSEDAGGGRRDDNRVAWDDRSAAPIPAGDFRGPYGYGRPAHKADPNAAYVFDVGVPRVLPPRRHIAPARLIGSAHSASGN